MPILDFEHVILTSGTIQLPANNSTVEVLRFGWTKPGGIILIFAAAAFNNSLDLNKQFTVTIDVFANNVQIQNTLGLPPNTVLQSVGTPPASSVKNETFASLWVARIRYGDTITLKMSATATSPPATVTIPNLNTHMTIINFNALTP